MEKNALDEMDRRILRTLQRNGRISVVDLADKVGLSPTPCARRIARMEEEGIIAGYGAQVDPARVGRPLTVFIFVELDVKTRKTLETFEQAIRRFEDVVECHLMTGTRDILLKIACRDLVALDRFLENDLLQLPGIRATRTNFSLRTMVSRAVAVDG